MGHGDLRHVIQELHISKEQWDTIRAHAESCAPLEACGLLAGKDSKVEKVFLIRNQAQSHARFAMDPLEQLAAFEWIESNGLDLLSILHSHPAGPETVSATDIAEAAYPVVHIVVSQQDGAWRARGFWIEDGAAREVVLQIG
jgi:proteasome lid subunit RPN8/RPN11